MSLRPICCAVALALFASACELGPDAIVCTVGCELSDDEAAANELPTDDQVVTRPPLEPLSAQPDDAGDADAGSDPDATAVTPDAASTAPDAAPATPDAGHPPGLLDTSIVKLIVEPEGSGHDDLSRDFTDRNYWNFCAPGAVTAALYFFVPDHITGWPAGYFKEPAHRPSTIPTNGTYWKSHDSVNGYQTYGRAYMMHLAMQVDPPSFLSPGMIPFDAYPTSGSNLVDIRDTLNWEASGHAGNWRTFFYEIAHASGLTASTLHHDVKQDIDGGHALVVTVDTDYLPNWSRSLSHAITVVGYDDDARTYKYVDTCGKRCNGSSSSRNGGVWTIAQSTLYNGIKANGLGYVW